MSKCSSANLAALRENFLRRLSLFAKYKIASAIDSASALTIAPFTLGITIVLVSSTSVAIVGNPAAIASLSDKLGKFAIGDVARKISADHKNLLTSNCLPKKTTLSDKPLSFTVLSREPWASLLAYYPKINFEIFLCSLNKTLKSNVWSSAFG